jgi:hypothetical protein
MTAGRIAGAGARPADLEKRVRAICRALPEATERLSHGAPNFFYKDKRSFLSLLVNGHHQNQFPHFWCAGPLGMQEDLIDFDPETFFRPPYVGSAGWVGVRLDRGATWPLIERVIRAGYEFAAAKSAPPSRKLRRSAATAKR